MNTASLETVRYALHVSYSDVACYEIVRTVSEKTVEVRRMNAIPDPSWRPAVSVGGFAGHVSNDRERTYTFESSPEHPIVRIRLGKRGWKSASGCNFVLSTEPREFYDSNF
jgi:hypothetical protein